MGKKKENPKPIAQVVVFELLAAYGLIRLLQTGSPEDPWTVRFVYNACFFLAAYPFLAFWRSGGVPGLLRFFLFPVGWALRAGLMVSVYLWVAYLFWSLGHGEVVLVMMDRPVALGALFFLLYCSFFGPLLGTTGDGASLADLNRLILFSVGLGAIGYLIGRGMDVTLAERQWAVDQRLWLTLIVTMVFALFGSWGGKVRSKKED